MTTLYGARKWIQARTLLGRREAIHKKQCERFYDCEEHAECIDGECVCLIGFMGKNFSFNPDLLHHWFTPAELIFNNKGKRTVV